MIAALLAACAAACGVMAAWELVVLVEAAAPARLLAPLLAAGREGPSAAERRRLGLVAAGCLLAAGWLLAGPVAGAGLAAAGPVAVGRVVAWRRARWRAELVAGAGATARALADALAGGHAVRGAIVEAAQGMVGATGEELRAAGRALALGDRTDDVLMRVRSRVRDPSWDAIVAAIAIQRASGGNLARLLRDLSVAIDDRLRTEADARAATAQARMTAWIVVALPAVAAALAGLADPGALASLIATAPSTALTLAALACEAAGLVAVRTVVQRAAR